MRAFIFLGLIALSFAVTYEAQMEEYEQRDHPFSMLADLAKGVAETQVVTDLLTKVKGKTTHNRNTLIAEFAEITKKHIATVKRLKALIAEYKAKIAQLKREIADTKAAIADAKSRIAEAHKVIDYTEKAIDKENKRRARQHAIYITKEKNLLAGEKACGIALELMAKVAKADISKGNQIVALKHSFVQVASELRSEVSKVRAVLEEHASDNIDIMMVETLVESAVQGINGGLINLIINKISALQATLKAEREATIRADAADLARHIKLIAHYNAIIKVQQNIIKVQTARLHRLEKKLAQLEKDLAHFEHLLKITQIALKKENEHYAFEKKRYTAAIAKLAKDIKALEAALAYLDSQSYANGAKSLERSKLMHA
jgi:predicted  nucleic acid-binding Zn-ribbon protein